MREDASAGPPMDESRVARLFAEPCWDDYVSARSRYLKRLEALSELTALERAWRLPAVERGAPGEADGRGQARAASSQA